MTLTKTVIDPHTSPLEGAAALSSALEAEMSCFYPPYLSPVQKSSCFLWMCETSASFAAVLQ